MPEEKDKKKDLLVTIGLVAITLLAAFFMARFEVERRAKREYIEGEKFLSFHRTPDLKKQYYDEKLRKKEITEPEYEMLIEDNALKNAYVQYQTVVDLFTPPESKWVKMSRERLKEITPEYEAWVAALKKEVESASQQPKKPK
ncbi:MAG TPA: hypothetical protein P5511_09805 [Candidatus Goldiibacteriota bacterium]|nr:hypothetical protein [Candidatus Goldiibacteriota bacterium]